jgi:DNA-binding NarL/FixJ family response regulator
MTIPKMTGLELSEQLLIIRPNIPIVLCTGFSLGITVKRIRDAGIKEFVMKSMIADELASAVYSALNPDQA